MYFTLTTSLKTPVQYQAVVALTTSLKTPVQYQAVVALTTSLKTPVQYQAVVGSVYAVSVVNVAQSFVAVSFCFLIFFNLTRKPNFILNCNVTTAVLRTRTLSQTSQPLYEK